MFWSRFWVRSVCVLLVLLLAPTSLGCGVREKPTAHGLLLAMQETELPLPPGRSYLRAVPTEDPRYLSDALITALLGSGAYPPEMDGVCDVAWRISYTHPCELAVFQCRDLRSADAVAKLCLRRLDALRQHLPEGEGEDGAYLSSARVTVRGVWVVLCVFSDPDAALRAFRRAL